MPWSESQRRRSGDTLVRGVLKWLAGVGSALIVAGIGWNFSTIVDLRTAEAADHAQLHMVVYLLRYNGIDVPKAKK